MGIITKLAILMILMVIISVPFQISIVQTLQKKGYDASIFLFKSSNLRKFRKIMLNENEKSIKLRMKLTYFGYIIPILTGISCFITIIVITALTK
ncbi:hypothetical protein [Labilibaculum antarcticum]|uniref:hypothetical protein n=1 Tax=Labilibaculum antarcticum TaxID=1717717 RepID=UPI000BBAE8A5|nr:hypothetical protein [Labilibaculum antarcticum]